MRSFNFSTSSNNRNYSRNRNVLCESLCILEDRITPIVGQSQIAIPTPIFAPGSGAVFQGADLVAPGTNYDGVVMISNNLTGALPASGALIATYNNQGYGHHVLTAAHVIKNGGKSTIGFVMPRNGYPEGVLIEFELPDIPEAQIWHSAFDKTKSVEYDIGVLRLVDTVSLEPISQPQLT